MSSFSAPLPPSRISIPQTPTAAAPSEGSPRKSPISPSLSVVSSASKAAARAHRAHAKALEATKRTERNGIRAGLIVRRDTLAYFDVARMLGPQVFLDNIPPVFNAVFIVTAGNVVKGLDGITFIGGDSVCGADVHFYVAVLIMMHLGLIGYMSWVAFGMGGRGTSMINTHIGVPWFVLSVWHGGACAWTVFYGIPLTLPAFGSICASKKPALFCGLSINTFTRRAR
jgi:hypothetical protein